MTQLKELRKQIDAIDKNIIECIASRQKISQQIGEFKALNNLPIFDLEREEWLKNYHANLCVENNLPYTLVAQLFDVIIEFSRKKQNNKL